MHTTREKDIVVRLLQAYKNMPFLWDTRHAEYKNRKARVEGMEKLVKIFKELEPSANAKSLSKRLSNMRTNYIRELKKVKSSIQSSTGPDDIYIPTIYYYEHMKFLDKQIALNENNGIKSYDDEDDSLVAEYIEISTLDPLDEADMLASPASSVAGSASEIKFKPNESETKDIEKRITLKRRKQIKPEDWDYPDNFNRPSRKVGEEDWAVLGKSIGLQLRGLDKDQLAIANKLISDAIYHAKFGQLTLNSFIELGQPPS